MSEGPERSTAERRLLDAVRAGEMCDFADGGRITAEEMAVWGAERTVDAAFVRRLLVGQGNGDRPRSVRLRGAVIGGTLNLRGLDVPALTLTGCRVASLDSSGGTFTRGGEFTGTTFTGSAVPG